MVGINPFTKTRIRQRAKNVVGAGRRKRREKAKVRFLALQIELQPDGQLERLIDNSNHQTTCMSVCVCECHVILIKNGAMATCSGLSGS